ncbi:glutamyl aminopeptidase-like isoform X2 [Pseudomyrmex gracilis]|nr:glutamyl aminopeptidase-like isoform X2 [Pseudomyrmex gracilis]
MSVVKSSYRLPSEVKPVHYDLLLHPVLENSTFIGNVTILIDVLDKRKTILLHQKDLKITDTKLTTYGLETDYEVEIEDTKYADHDMFVVVLKNDLKPGLYNLSMVFNGSMANKMVGLYTSKYVNKKKTLSYIATTKFEPTYARQAFPCFDEPNLKATFTIKLRYNKQIDYHPLSNMNIVEQIQGRQDREAYTIFEKSKRMSTYLACVILSNFNGQTKTATTLNTRSFNVTVYTAPIHDSTKSILALDTAVEAIQYYAELFRTDYPLPKLDLVAIPDFVSGAMENWGLVTFRETRLLHDSYNDPINHKHDVVNVVCHELAHMWFGNLVTMSWWNDLWLNEGFATYMSYKSANDFQPNEGHMNNFVVEIMHPVLSYDSTKSTHPIIYDVNNPDEITSFFDDISYKKGACVLRMIENFITSDVFYGAITNYLEKYAYGNAETKDLLSCLQDAIGNKLNITDIIDPWTKQKGYPVINVKRHEEKCILTQQYYRTNNDDDDDKTEEEDFSSLRWTIPITYITNKNGTPTLIWFDKNEEKVELILNEDTRWIKFNVDQVGYYRVNYNIEWSSLASLLSYHHTRLSIADRVNLLDDVFSLAEDGHCSYRTAFTFIKYLSEEYSAAPWETVYSKLLPIYNMIELNSLESSEIFLQYLRKAYRFNIYRDAGWIVNETTEDTGPFHITRRARIAILRFACFIKIEECLNEVNKLFNAWLDGLIELHPDIRSLVYYYGLRSSGKNMARDSSLLSQAWHRLFDKFLNETDPNEKNRIMYGLTGIESDIILRKFIEMAKQEQYVRPQDFLNCLIMISKNTYGSIEVWDWVRANWEFLVNRYTLNDRYLGQLIPSITRYFFTPQRYQELKNFFEKWPDAGAGASGRLKAEAQILKNQKWFKNHEKEIAEICL